MEELLFDVDVRELTVWRLSSDSPSLAWKLLRWLNKLNPISVEPLIFTSFHFRFIDSTPLGTTNTSRSKAPKELKPLKCDDKNDVEHFCRLSVLILRVGKLNMHNVSHSEQLSIPLFIVFIGTDLKLSDGN